MQEPKSERRFSGEKHISSVESLEVNPLCYQASLNSTSSSSSLSYDHRHKTRHSSLETEKNQLNRENSVCVVTAEQVTTAEMSPKTSVRASNDVAVSSSVPHKKLVIVLAVCFLVAGTIQTLSLKFTEGISARDAFSGIAGNNMVGTSVTADSNTDGNHFVHSFYAVQFFFEFSFTHPFAQAFFMFTAESLCLVILLFQRIFQNKKTLALPHHPLVYVIPAASDFFASLIQNVGLFLTYASVYQMLRGAAVVWIAVLSRIVFHRHYAKIQKCGIATVMLGLTLVGMSSIIGRPSPTSQEASVQYPHQMFGNLLIFCAQFLHGVQGVAEERLLQLYDIPPLQVIGIEGLFGLSLSIMLLAILQWYPSSVWGSNLSQLVVEEYGMGTVSSLSSSVGNASFSTPLSLLHVTEWGSQCPEMSGLMSSLHAANDDTGSTISIVNSTMTSAGLSHMTPNEGRGYFPLVPYDDINLVFQQMQNNSTCLIVVLFYIFSGLVYNVAQISIIKLLSAAATVLLGSLRNISVWVMCLILPFFHETINVVQIIGFCFLIFGNILFQRVLYSDFESFLPSAMINACPIIFKER